MARRVRLLRSEDGRPHRSLGSARSAAAARATGTQRQSAGAGTPRCHARRTACTHRWKPTDVRRQCGGEHRRGRCLRRSHSGNARRVHHPRRRPPSTDRTRRGRPGRYASMRRSPSTCAPSRCSSVVWCTGYAGRAPWLDPALTDETGQPSPVRGRNAPITGPLVCRAALAHATRLGQLHSIPHRRGRRRKSPRSRVVKGDDASDSRHGPPRRSKSVRRVASADMVTSLPVRRRLG